MLGWRWEDLQQKYANEEKLKSVDKKLRSFFPAKLCKDCRRDSSFHTISMGKEVV